MLLVITIIRSNTRDFWQQYLEEVFDSFRIIAVALPTNSLHFLDLTGFASSLDVLEMDLTVLAEVHNRAQEVEEAWWTKRSVQSTQTFHSNNTDNLTTRGQFSQHKRFTSTTLTTLQQEVSSVNTNVSLQQRWQPYNNRSVLSTQTFHFNNTDNLTTIGQFCQHKRFTSTTLTMLQQ